MKVLKYLSNYFFYCGIGREEYHKVKKGAYVSNFIVWRALHFLMAAVFASLFISSLFNELLETNRLFYIIAFVYSVAAMGSFFLLKKDSLIAQLIIYLSISLLFLFAGFITQNKPEIPATTFIVFLLLAPMFMIDKPFFMAIELSAASAVFLTWMHSVKPHDVWVMDVINVVTFTIVGIFLNIIANSIRIREFVLARKLNIQKDTDELTGLKNKSALTREINAILKDSNENKGILFMMDVDKFKSINDTFGHDVGDDVIVQFGTILSQRFSNDELAGRFGGDEFIVFIKDTDSSDKAREIANGIISGASEVTLPNDGSRMSVSIGAALYSGDEKDFSEIFKKADTALYRAKADEENRFCIFEG
ncbi:MAG: GGDEF domain-containing protein [Lachnospiraceae bacterium]|nr:GGDEF domain-containing protein [Lachnospiraceae bacterium]